MLELVLQDLIGSLIAEHQGVGKIITAELSFKNLRGLVSSLYLDRHGQDKDYANLKALLSEAQMIEEIRNSIIHSIWAGGKDKDHITRMKTTAKEKKGLKFQFQELSAKDLKDFALRIQKCHNNIHHFYITLVFGGKAINNPILKTW